MRGKVSDQDLTDYALNELGPEERLYVESILAVSEECRNDVYETIETALLLDEGFEREDTRAPALALTAEQRMALLNVRMPNRFWHRTAAVLAAAAAIALAFVHRDDWMPKGGPVSQVARVSHEVGDYMVQAVTAAEGEDFVNQLASFRKLTDEPGKWLPAQPPAGASIAAPPASFNIEIAPHSGLEFSD